MCTGAPPRCYDLDPPPPGPVCGNFICEAGESSASCPTDCPPPTYTIGGTVFIDENVIGEAGYGVQNCSGLCNNGPGDELGYGGASIQRVGPGADPTTTSDNSGSDRGEYAFNSVPGGTYNIILTIPSNYVATTATSRSITVGPSNTNVHFGIRPAPPACTPGSISLNPSGSTVQPGNSVTLSVTTCTNVENPDNGTPPPPFSWNPDTTGNNPPPTVSGQTNTPTSSTTTWTAPACPSAQSTYTPQVTVGGAGGTTNYTTSITVPATRTVTTHVRSVTDASSCATTSGNPYSSSGGSGASVNINGGTINLNQTTSTVTGSTQFACLPGSITYTVTLVVPSGYSVVGRSGGTNIGSNQIRFSNLSSNQTAVFCVAPIDPWFQTDLGNVRFVSLQNPVPTGRYSSTGENTSSPQSSVYPGIYYSSSTNAQFGEGAVSSRNWVVNNEYSYNANTENRNGGMSYDFYKSKARQDGVTITPISSGTFDESEITGSGVYEVDGNLTINNYTHVNGRRVVLLVDENVTINDSSISIPVNQGLFIVAAKGNITISSGVGTTTPSSTTSNLDGYYTAQGSIVVESASNTCADGTTPDRRLNIGGALIANSLKPFSTSGTGTIQNRRSLCIENLNYPSLYVSSRPDFLTQLTDFYKTSYSKWKELNP